MIPQALRMRYYSPVIQGRASLMMMAGKVKLARLAGAGTRRQSRLGGPLAAAGTPAERGVEHVVGRLHCARANAHRFFSRR